MLCNGRVGIKAVCRRVGGREIVYAWGIWGIAVHCSLLSGPPAAVRRGGAIPIGIYTSELALHVVSQDGGGRAQRTVPSRRCCRDTAHCTLGLSANVPGSREGEHTRDENGRGWTRTGSFAMASTGATSEQWTPSSGAMLAPRATAVRADGGYSGVRATARHGAEIDGD